MLRIGESIYKVFDEGIIRTSVEDQTNLLQVSSFYGSRHDGFSYYENHITDSQLDFCHEDGCNCNTIETIVRKTNGNNRTYTRFYISEETIVFNDPALMDYYYQMGIRYIYYYMKIRPYKRTLGVWYWCRRTIMYNMNYHVISTDNNAYYSNFTISGNEQGQESGGKVDKILHGYTGYTQSGRYKLLSGTTSTPDASCSVNCPNM